MLKIIYLWLIILIIQNTFSTAMAGEEQSVVDSLIQKALKKNPDIIAAEFEYQAVRFKEKASGWLPDPTISIVGSNLPRGSLSLDQTPMSGISIGYTQKIPWPGKLVNQKRIAGLKAQNKNIAFSAWKNTVVRLVKSAYFEFTYWRLAEDIVNDNIALMEALFEVARTKYANGLGLAQDVLSAQTSLSKIEDRKLNVIKMKKAALANLNRLTNESNYSLGDIPAVLPLIGESSAQIELLIESASKDNPLLELSRNEVELANGKKSLVKNGYWPDITLAVEYRLREEAPMDAVNGEDFISARVGLSLPVWFWKKQNNLNKAAEKESRTARFRQESIERKIEYEITNAFLELERKRQGFHLYDEAIIPQAEAALESANIAYQVGKVDFLNLLTAQMRLFEMQIEKLGMLKDYNQTLAALDEIVGKNYGEN